MTSCDSVQSWRNLLASAALVQNLVHLRLLGQNAVELLSDYDGAIDHVVADIDRATNHVHLLYNIFSDDTAGAKVIDALGRAVRRGVVARVLVDYLGSSTWWSSVSAKLSSAGVTVHRVLPISFLRRKSARADLWWQSARSRGDHVWLATRR